MVDTIAFDSVSHAHYLIDMQRLDLSTPLVPWHTYDRCDVLRCWEGDSLWTD